MLFVTVTGIIILVFLIANMFSGGGSARTQREIFYGTYYAEDAVTCPEDVPNSRESIEKCINAGMGIKTSVHATKDRRAVVSTYDDLSKEYGVDKKISQCDLEELEALGIMALPQLVELVDGQVPLILELKSGENNEKLCRYTADIIISSGHKNIGVTSFHTGMISWFKEKEKKIFRGLTSAPAKDFKFLSKVDRFMTGNLMSNSVCRPQFVLYRNKPQSIFVKFAFAIGLVKGIWTITDENEGKRLEEEKDMIVCRGFMPEHPHYKDLPRRVKTQAEIDAEKKWEAREARRNARAEYKMQRELEKEQKKSKKD